MQVPDPMMELNKKLDQRANFMRFNPWKSVYVGSIPPKEMQDATWLFRSMRSDSRIPGIGGSSQFYLWGKLLTLQGGWASRAAYAKESVTFANMDHSPNLFTWSRCSELVVVPLRRTLKEYPWLEVGREGESDTDEAFVETFIGLLGFGVHSIRLEEFRDRHWNYPAI
tara:strand:- start:726 stop:1229 length:504 start_codon:yes stop_codon:yes gene_type:complete